MALLSKPVIVKGVITPTTLSKLVLANFPAIQADTFFSDISNWKEVSLLFVNTDGQRELIVFKDLVAENPNSRFFFHPAARTNFTVASVMIYDHDGGKKLISRSDIPALEVTELNLKLHPALVDSEGNMITTESGEVIAIEYIE